MPISQSAKSFIVTVIALGGIFLIHSAVLWAGQPLLVTAYIIVAVLASMLKVRLPGIPGTFSANCLVTVLAIAQLNLPDLVFVSVACALVQSWWRTKNPPLAVQVAFNIGVFAVSGTASGWTYAALQQFAPTLPAIAALAIASCVFFLINTGAVSVIMALVEDVSPMRIWRVWHVWSLPYYLINVVVAVLIMSLTPASILLAIALVVPLALAAFAVYQWFMRRAAPAVAHAS